VLSDNFEYALGSCRNYSGTLLECFVWLCMRLDSASEAFMNALNDSKKVYQVPCVLLQSASDGSVCFFGSLECFGSASGMLWECFWNAFECFGSAFGMLLNALGVLLECFGSALGVLLECSGNASGMLLNALGVLLEFFGSALECFGSAFGLLSKQLLTPGRISWVTLRVSRQSILL
jgi:hypothetical protein